MGGGGRAGWGWAVTRKGNDELAGEHDMQAVVGRHVTAVDIVRDGVEWKGRLA